MAQNFDHYNTFTAYSLKQVLEYCQLKDVQPFLFPLHPYVFYRNPLNYVTWGVSFLLSLIFRIGMCFYGK